MEYFLAPKGIKVNIGSFAAVATVLFVSPSAPAAQKFNVFVAHIGCALISVLLLLLLGVTPLTKAVAVAACVVFMLFTSSLHPPASGLPLIFLDSPKLQRLRWWYPLVPCLLGCLWIFLLQELVLKLKAEVQF
eukprot:TRINITY_DN1763_c0_g3_i1.p1 TRINITY_DN1763_c0_g3~~TRINITY_DN1763_c0_g3_i1.p1  ORF type:complete len:152 (-),score=52.60 TRINITY_DN1763_c0_g3_i1:224-622(-)